MFKKKTKIKAFTLAEVLITLTIIGVIAAITIPVLSARQADLELASRIKKSYSVISRAANKVNLNDFGGDTQCYYSYKPLNEGGTAVTSGCLDFYKVFFENLNVQKECKGNALRDGCIPNYDFSWYNTSSQQTKAGCSGYSPSYVNNNSYARVLADGMILFSYSGDGKADTAPLFAIDVNGFKGPNKVGKDVYSLAFYNDTDRGFSVPPSSKCMRNELIEEVFAGGEI